MQIALVVIVAWGRTIYAQFELLAGKSAPHDFLQLIIYKAMTFSDEIEKVDTVRAYHVCHLLSSRSDARLTLLQSGPVRLDTFCA
jgi:hypothetical protein